MVKERLKKQQIRDKRENKCRRFNFSGDNLYATLTYCIVAHDLF